MVYVVRRRWADSASLVVVATGDAAPLETVPTSFGVLQLEPGEHCLTAAWPNGSADLVVRGSAGQVIVVELIGSVWTWGSRYRFEPVPLDARDHFQGLKLIGVTSASPRKAADDNRADDPPRSSLAQLTE